jgi:xylan 1,4-beta-xylosidase
MEILVWNYHDDDVAAPPAAVMMTIDGLSPGRPTITQYRVDDRHSNAYEAWKAMGSPQSLTSAQRRALEKAGQLESIGTPARQAIDRGRLTIDVSLPRQGVALFTIAY